jgi:hypothetical protein
MGKTHILFLALATLPVSLLAQSVTQYGADTLTRRAATTDRQIDIEAVRVSSRPADINVTGVAMGVRHLEIAQIRRMPALMGEVDVIKAIQMMPGVQMTSEGGSGFSVRGGSPDQNLILLDDATVYNPSHLMGFFSIFNNDFVSSADLYKGDMPLRYGGRLSALLDVSTVEGRPAKFSGTGGVGLITSRAMLKGPVGENTSWWIGGRRSYADLFLKLSPNKDLRNTILHFFDLNAKVSHRFSKKDMIQATGYYGRDNFGMGDIGEIAYGNAAATVGWRHIYNDRLLSRLTFHFSDYTYRMGSSMDGFNASWRSGIRDYGLRLDFEHSLSGGWDMTWGVGSTLHVFEPGEVAVDHIELVPVIGSNALEHAAYLSLQHPIGGRVTLRYGARLTAFQNMGRAQVYRFDEAYNTSGEPTNYRAGEIYHTFVAAEPRVGMVVRIGPNSSVKANYSRNVQFMQLANNSASGSPLDVWFAAGPNIAPQRSHLWSVGYFHNLRNNMFAFSAEVYLRDMRNVIDFRDGADLMLNGKLDGEVRTGRGRACGLELALSKERGRLTGFVNYTLSRSERTIAGINDGHTYAAPYDKTHAVNLSLAWNISPAWDVSLNWVYATGNPTTWPVARSDIEGELVTYYSARNAYRFPDYHRMDVSVTWRPNSKTTRRWHGEWNVSLYNVYNRRNPWMVRLSQYESGVNYAERIYLFGLVPSITYNFTF